MGDLVASESLNLWSELVLIILGLPEIETTRSEAGQTRYTSPEAIARQLSDDPRIRLVDAGKDLASTGIALLNAGLSSFEEFSVLGFARLGWVIQGR